MSVRNSCTENVWRKAATGNAVSIPRQPNVFVVWLIFEIEKKTLEWIQMKCACYEMEKNVVHRLIWPRLQETLRSGYGKVNIKLNFDK